MSFPKSSDPAQGALVEFQSGKKLIGMLHWYAGAMSLETAAEQVLAAWKTKVREVDVRRREPYLDSGLRLEVRFSNDSPTTMKMAVGIFHHRGRLYSLMIWTHQGDWFEFGEEIDRVFKSVALSGPPPECHPLAAGSVAQSVRSPRQYAFELPAGWTFEEVDPPDGTTVARFWSTGGFPAGQVMVVNHPGRSGATILEEFLQMLPPEQKLDVQEKRKESKRIWAIFAQTMGTTRYRTLMLTLDRGNSTLSFQASAKDVDYERFKQDFASMRDTFQGTKD